MLTKKIKRRLFFIISIVIITLFFLIFVYLNLKQNILYFKTPSDIFQENEIQNNSKIRVGGMVKKDSILQNNKEIKLGYFCSVIFGDSCMYLIGSRTNEGKNPDNWI